MNKEDDNKKDAANIPRDINHKDVDFKQSAKKWTSNEKIDTKESRLRKDLNQDAADEQFAQKDSQIDKDTIKLQEQKKAENDNSESNQ